MPAKDFPDLPDKLVIDADYVVPPELLAAIKGLTSMEPQEFWEDSVVSPRKLGAGGCGTRVNLNKQVRQIEEDSRRASVEDKKQLQENTRDLEEMKAQFNELKEELAKLKEKEKKPAHLPEHKDIDIERK